MKKWIACICTFSLLLAATNTFAIKGIKRRATHTHQRVGTMHAKHELPGKGHLNDGIGRGGFDYRRTQLPLHSNLDKKLSGLPDRRISTYARTNPTIIDVNQKVLDFAAEREKLSEQQKKSAFQVTPPSTKEHELQNKVLSLKDEKTELEWRQDVLNKKAEELANREKQLKEKSDQLAMQQTQLTETTTLMWRSGNPPLQDILTNTRNEGKVTRDLELLAKEREQYTNAYKQFETEKNQLTEEIRQFNKDVTLLKDEAAQMGENANQIVQQLDGIELD